MYDLLANVAEMRRRAVEMKAQVLREPPSDNARLREALYELEAAIYTMERAAADAYSAAEAR